MVSLKVKERKMSNIIDGKAGTRLLIVGNEAIARGVLEAGITVAAAYPGTPATEILENLGKAAKKYPLYVEWSANEKVAMEVAAAGSLAGLRSMTPMKQAGVNVAADFLVHLALIGTRGGMIMVPCDDPAAISSGNEEESRLFAQLAEIPLLEPSDAQEAKDMIKWAIELSEHIHNVVMVRSVTRLSHTNGTVVLGEIPVIERKAEFRHEGHPLDQDKGVVFPFPVVARHDLQQKKLKQAQEWFEESPFNTYTGPDAPELMIVTSSVCHLYTKEALQRLGFEEQVGVLKLGTTWPLPPKLMEKHLRMTDRILVVEETLPVMENTIKILAMDLAPKIGIKTFHGKGDGLLPKVGEIQVDLVAIAIAKLFGIEYAGAAPSSYVERAQEIVQAGVPGRELTFCAGCPHRASMWSIRHALKMDNRGGFVTGDIGCYFMDILPSGFQSTKAVFCMGAGTGLASGFGKLGDYGMDQPVIAACGDSTFFHAVIPALANAIHNKSNIIIAILDNGGTAMTGFQPHPGLKTDAKGGNELPAIDIASVCRGMGARVEICDPFDPEQTQKTLLELLDDEDGVKVLILKQICALSPEKKGKKLFDVRVNESLCVGESCGCNRLCTRILKCPGLGWDESQGKARIDEAVCSGCGFCTSICPQGAIEKKEVA